MVRSCQLVVSRRNALVLSDLISSRSFFQKEIEETLKICLKISK